MLRSAETLTFLCILVILFQCYQSNAIPKDYNTFQLQETKCYFNRQYSNLKCNSSLGSLDCMAFMDRIPINTTTFGIGEIKATDGANPLVWFRLYPKKSDNQGWWYFRYDYIRLSIQSKQSVSDTKAGLVVLDSSCWSSMNMIIRSSNSIDVIKTEKFNKDIFSKPYEKVRIIGTLTIIN